MSRLIAEIQRYIAPHIIERGRTYFQQGLVENVRVEGSWVHALVLGNYGDYDVSVNTDNIAESECDCPYDDYCKHMAAVCFYIVREGLKKDDGREAAAAAKEQKEPADVMSFANLSREDLLDVLRRLLEDKPHIAENIKLILRERESMAQLQQVRQRGLYSSLQYYGEMVPAVLQECESLFVEEPYDEVWYEEGYVDPDSACWDFSAGFVRLDRFGRELLSMVVPEHYISGTVGLLVCVLALGEWRSKYFNEYSNEIDDGCDEFEVYLTEALNRVKAYAAASDADAQVFLRELVEWMVLECKEPGDLLNWTVLMGSCIYDVQGLWHLKEKIRELDKNFLQSKRLNEREQTCMAYWWVSLCLDFNCIEEAIAAVGSHMHDDTFGRLFVRYYERKECWQEAQGILRDLLKNGKKPSDYRWMVDLCQKANDAGGALL